MIGKLNVPDGRNVLRADLIRQESHCGGGGLCLGGAAGEGGVVVQIKFLCKVQQREAVTEYDGAVRQACKEIMKFTVQRVDLGGVSLGVGPVLLGVGAVQRGQRFPELPGDGGGIGGRGPNVFVDFRHAAEMKPAAVDPATGYRLPILYPRSNA